MEIIRWENPPKDKHDEVTELADKLRERPGEWALVWENLPGGEAYELVNLFSSSVENVELKSVGGGYIPKTVYARFVPKKRGGWNGDH